MLFNHLKPKFFEGAGVESMTMGYGAGTLPTGYSDVVLTNQEAEDCLLPMGLTSENVAADFNISRATQDAFAARSFQKAAKAAKEGRFKDEILPIKVTIVDPKTENTSPALVIIRNHHARTPAAAAAAPIQAAAARPRVGGSWTEQPEIASPITATRRHGR